MIEKMIEIYIDVFVQEISKRNYGELRIQM